MTKLINLITHIQHDGKIRNREKKRTSASRQSDESFSTGRKQDAKTCENVGIHWGKKSPSDMSVQKKLRDLVCKKRKSPGN